MSLASRSIRAVLWSLTALLSTTTAHAVIHQVELSDLAITPDSITVAPGDSVKWLVLSGSHQLHSDTDSFKSWDSGPLDTVGATFLLPIHFDDGPGPFLYLCLSHAHRGEIRVSDSCFATGISDGGTVPAVSDLVYALNVIIGAVPTPDNLYRFDLSGDCVVGELDATLLVKWFEFGPDSLPDYPMPTCCRPELEIMCSIGMTGDLDPTGTLTSADVIQLVGYVFKGAQTPHPCAAVADINCSASVSSSDVIALVNHVFKGGPPPCDVCALIPGQWTCP